MGKPKSKPPTSNKPVVATPTTSKKPRSRAAGAPPPSSAIKGTATPAQLVPTSDDDSDDEAVEAQLDVDQVSSSDDDWEDAEDGESGSDGDGITQSAVDKLMALLSDEDVPEEELAALGVVGDAPSDVDQDDEEAVESGSDSDEEMEDAEAEVEEEDGVEYEDLPSDSDNEDIGASVRRKVVKNDETALTRLLEALKPSSALSLDFFETQVLSHNAPLEVADVHDDIGREVELYKVALSAATRAHTLFTNSEKPFFRPSDYFAEMLKSDSHMEKIRLKLVDEAAALKASEEARRQRGLKKFGKAVQVGKRIEREKETKRVKEGVNELRKKRKGAGLNAADGGEDFDIALDTALDAARPTKRARTDGARGDRGRGSDGPKMPRKAREAKYGRPKPANIKGRRWKENDKASSSDFQGFGGRGMGRALVRVLGRVGVVVVVVGVLVLLGEERG